MASTPTNTDRFDHLGLEMPFGDHLEDLRRRVVYGLLGIVPIFFVALFVFAKPLVIFLLQPGNDAQRNSGNTPQYEVNGPFEFFNAYVKVAMVLTIIVGLPWVLYQGWKFVAPGLYAHEKRFAYTLVPMSAVLAALGVVFMYTVMLPVVMAFFIEFSSAVTGDESPLIERSADAPTSLTIETYPGNPANPSNGELWHNTYLNQLCIASVGKDGVTTIYATPLTLGTQLIRPDYRVADYIDTVFDFALAFAVAFQAPVAVLLLGWAGIINPGMMGKFRRHAIMVCTVLGAALTPADPFSIFLLAVPLYLLYEFGVVLLRWLPASRVAHGLRGEPPDPEASGP